MKSKLQAVGWAFSLTWRFNKKLLTGWTLLVSAAAVLPALALQYHQAIIAGLDRFLAAGAGGFNELLPTIVLFGVITALIGLSNRLNVEFIYSVMVMYDAYYFGMAELLMDGVQRFTYEELNNVPGAGKMV